MRFLQESAIAHTEELGMGRKKTLDRGFLWVICKESILIHRLPEYDEEILISSSPAKTLHYFFPRRCEIKDKKGNILIQSMSLWALMDKTARGFVDPEENGISILGEDRKEDIPLPGLIALPEEKKETEILASYSRSDLNGHLSNAFYLDIAEDLIPNDYLLSHDPKKIEIAFRKEILLGEKTTLSYGKEDQSYSFVCPNFSLRLTYQEAD